MRTTSLVLSLLLVSSVALAQGRRPAAAGDAAHGPITLTSSHQESWVRTKGYINNAAKEMPEDMAYKPGFNPRSIGQVLGHMADARFAFCAAARGVANPNNVNLQQTIKTKADALKAIADSEAYCDPVFASLTDASFVETITPISGIEGSGTTAMPRGAVLSELLQHDSIQYGYAVVYLRAVVEGPPNRAPNRGATGQQGGAVPPAGRGN